MFGIEWRNFKKRLLPKDEKEQAKINRQLCDYIYYLHSEIMQLKKDLKRRSKDDVVSAVGEESVG